MSREFKGFIAYAVILLLFTVYVLLDTFVIARAYGDAAEISSAAEQTSGQMAYEADGNDFAEDSDSEPAVGDNTDGNTENSSAGVISSGESYDDGNISITLSEYRESDTTVHVADVRVSSPEYLRTAFAQGTYGRNIKEATSSIAEDAGAVLAINGDFYGARESGYVIRNGTLYRDEASAGSEDLAIYADGSFEIISEDEVSAQELLDSGVVQTLSFGPALVDNGEIAVGVGEEVSGRSMASNPRTAIGIIDECHYIFVVSDGRTNDSAGLSLYDLAEVMKELGCTTAYNLDGGGSSTMYFNGSVVNTPTGGHAGHGSGTERSVSDIIYIG